MSGIKKTAREMAQDRCEALIAAAQERIGALENQIGNDLHKIGQKIAGEFSIAQTSASEQDKALAELRLLRSESAAYAYASLVALEKQGYQLRETITGNNIQAWFTEQGDPSRNILLTISKQEKEGDSWLEELKMIGFDDDCLDILDLYDNDIAAMGIRKRSRTIIKPDDSGQKQRRSSSARERRLEKE